MKNYSISKTIALSLGVLAMSLLISFMVLAWTEPGVTPPEENVAGPLLSEPDDLNLAGATWTERSITNINILSGFDDLFLLGNSDETAPVHMGGSELKFYTGGIERMNINSDGEVGINTFKFSPVSTTELGIYDSAGNVILIFDEGL